MATIIITISRFLIIILGAFYTLFCFTVFSPSNAGRQDIILNRQVKNLFVMHFFCYLVLYIRTENINIIMFYGAQVIFIFMIQFLYRHIYPHSSRLIVNNMCFLLVAGLVMLTRLNYDQAVRQGGIIVVSMIVLLCIPYLIIKLNNLDQLYWWYCIGGILALISVFAVGSTINGAKNWLKIGPLLFQPSEFVKILFIYFVASMLAKSSKFKHVVLTTAIAALHVVILVLETDLGGALLFFVVYLVMLYVATGNHLYFLSGLAAGSFAATIAFKLFSHVQVRVEAWRNPWPIIDGRGAQIAQSLFAIGTGGWFGLGLGGGMPYRIPVVISDFIFAGIAEELGTIFALCLTLVCVSCFILFIDIAMRHKQPFFKLLAIGFGICYMFQVFLNIGGVTKFIPSTGVTLPFVSHGGSSIVSSFVIFNILQGLHIIVQKEEEANEKGIEKVSRNQCEKENASEANRVNEKRKQKKKEEKTVK